MDAERLFRDNLALVDQVVDGVCRRRRVFGADAEDFASMVKVALMENDYAILRSYEGRAGLGTYLTIVVERLLLDLRTHERGRWRPSVEATKMGPAGRLLETLVRRDRRPLEEAIPLVRGIEPALTRAEIAAMVERLPDRAPRPVPVEIDEVADDLAAAEATDAPLFENEARRASGRAAEVVRQTMAALDPEDRVLLRMRYVSEMRISDIARMTRLPQRPLYRRLETLLLQLRRALEAAGISGDDAEEVLAGARTGELDFGWMENNAERQSIHDEPEAARESP